MQSGLYRHYKGGVYQLIGLAAHSETGEALVVYVSLDASLPGFRMRVRPRSLWDDDVEWPDGNTRPRFIFIGEVLREA